MGPQEILKRTMNAKYYRKCVNSNLRAIIDFSSSYRPSQLYKVVSDVASYPHFLPFCTGTRILFRTPPKDATALGPAGTVRMEAEMTVGFMAFEEGYISNVTCVPNESVEASLDELVACSCR